MRSFSPATWLLIGFLLALASCTAFAETIPSTSTPSVINEYQYHYAPGEHGGGCDAYTYNFASGSAAGEATRACKAAKSGQTVTFSNCSNNVQGVPICDVYFSTSGSQGRTNVASATGGCLAPATWNGSACVGDPVYSCPAGYALSADQQSCSRSDCQPGTKVDSGMYTDTDGNGITPRACQGGCWADFKGTGPYNHYSFNSQIYDSVYIGDYIADGQHCSESSSTETPVTASPEQTQPVDTPEYDCASQGMSSGTVNGVVLCVPPGTPDSPPVTDGDKTQQQNPDGSKTETSTRDTVNGDSVTRETTTTQYDSSGNVVSQSTSSTTGSTGSFCEQNPNSEVCAKSKVTGGDGCDVAPVCKGDAATCAILRQQWEARCEIKKQNDFVSEAGDVGVFESKATEINDKKTELGNLISQIRGEAAGLFTFSGAGAATLGCDAGVTTTQGFHVELCFSKYDDELQMIGAVLVFVSLVIAVFIMFS